MHVMQVSGATQPWLHGPHLAPPRQGRGHVSCPALADVADPDMFALFLLGPFGIIGKVHCLSLLSHVPNQVGLQQVPDQSSSLLLDAGLILSHKLAFEKISGCMAHKTNVCNAQHSAVKTHLCLVEIRLRCLEVMYTAQKVQGFVCILAAQRPRRVLMAAGHP